MTKLIRALRITPSRANLARIDAYLAKHPMSACLMSAEDTDLIERARKVLAA